MSTKTGVQGGAWVCVLVAAGGCCGGSAICLVGGGGGGGAGGRAIIGPGLACDDIDCPYRGAVWHVIPG